MILTPEQYPAASTAELLGQAARGYIPLDHRFLRVLLGRGESIVPDLVSSLKEPRTEDRVDLDAFELDVARALGAPAALPFLAEFARVYEFEFSDELTEAFVEAGEAAVDTLLALAEESKGAGDVRFTLAGLGVHDARILAMLLGVLETDPMEGALALGLYGDPAAIPALEMALAVAGDDDRLRHEIEIALDDVRREDQTRPEPFDVWSHYSEEDTPSFAALDNSELLEFLASPIAEYRLRAVKMLTFDEPAPDIARKVLEIARTDPDTQVRAVAWECLEGVHEPAEIEQALRARLEDATAPMEERAGALVALAHEAGKDEHLSRLIAEFYEQPETRAQAVKAMWHSGDRQFENRIPAALADADLDVQRQAITAAGMFGMVSQLGRIESFFENEDLRGAALYAYALAAPSTVTPARMRKLLGKIEDLAGGLSREESVIVGKALDDRLEAFGHAPVFHTEEALEDEEEEQTDEPATPQPPAKVGRNDPCPCGSGKKYKKCCGQ